MRIDNQKIYDTYRKSILEGKKERIDEARAGMRRKAQILEDKIDDFFDEIERKIDTLEETPVFQTKMLQMLADATKEHNEFVMALKQICQTLDSGAKVIPNTKPHHNQFKPNTVDRDLEQQTPEDSTGVEDDAMNQMDTGVSESFVPKKDSVGHVQKVYSGQYKIEATPNGSAFYVMGLTNNDSKWVEVSSAFATRAGAEDFMAKLKKAESDQKQMSSLKWKEGNLKKNNEYRPKEM
jgi:predicted transcriptional regulator